VKKALIYIGIGLLIGVVLSGYVVKKCTGVSDNDTYSDTLTVYDSIPVYFADTVPVPYIVYDSIPLTYYDTIPVYESIPLPLDTAEVIADYYRARVYKDTIEDKDLQFFLQETVSANRIINRQTGYRILRPQQVITNKHYNNAIYGGLQVYYTGNDAGVAGMITYSGEKFTGSAGYDPIRKGVFLGGGIKILSW